MSGKVYRLMLECGHYVLLPGWAGPSRLGDATPCNVCPYVPRHAVHGVDKPSRRMLRRVVEAERVWETEMDVDPLPDHPVQED